MSEGTSYRCVRRLNGQPKSYHSICGQALANVSVGRPPGLRATLVRPSTARTRICACAKRWRPAACACATCASA